MYGARYEGSRSRDEMKKSSVSVAYFWLFVDKERTWAHTEDDLPLQRSTSSPEHRDRSPHPMSLVRRTASQGSNNWCTGGGEYS
jgi:hypothetical protein